MVYSTTYDKNPDRQIPDRTDRSPPDLFVPRRDLRYRSGIQQHRGMVALDPGGRPAAQGPALLSSARREFRIRIRRLCLGAEPVAGRFRRTDPALAGPRDFRQGQIRQLPAAQSLAELIRRPEHDPAKKAPGCRSAFSFVKGGLFRRWVGWRPAGGRIGFELLARF